MNKLFKLIYVNLLNLFDINKIVIARSEGVKSNLEKRTIMTGIIAIVYVYIAYTILSSLKINNVYYILSIGFFLSTLMCFFMNLLTIESLIFKDADNDILFSLPLTRHQILFSKLFNIYLKNMFTVAIIMISCFLVFWNKVGNITDTQVLMYIISTLVIPFVPMVLSTIVAYINDYFKLKKHNNIKYKIVKYFIILVLIGLIFLLFRDFKVNDINQGISILHNKLCTIYPLTIIFYAAIKKESLLCFCILVIISILIIYIYTLVISNNYLRICSMLKGIKKKDKFVYKKKRNLGKLFGIVRKEILNLFTNKSYFINSFGMSIILSIILIIILSIGNFTNIDKTIINLYLPALLTIIVGLGCSTISAMSLEKQNMQVLRTMPISIGRLLFCKWFTNIIIGIVIIIINGTSCLIWLNLTKWNILFNYLVPLVSLILISLTGLILDYRFIEKNEENDNVIIKQRIITIVPTFVSVIMGGIIVIFPTFMDYKIVMGSYILLFIILIIIELIYLILNRKRLVENLFN